MYVHASRKINILILTERSSSCLGTGSSCLGTGSCSATHLVYCQTDTQSEGAEQNLICCHHVPDLCHVEELCVNIQNEIL